MATWLLSLVYNVGKSGNLIRGGRELFVTVAIRGYTVSSEICIATDLLRESPSQHVTTIQIG